MDLERLELRRAPGVDFVFGAVALGSAAATGQRGHGADEAVEAVAFHRLRVLLDGSLHRGVSLW